MSLEVANNVLTISIQISYLVVLAVVLAILLLLGGKKAPPRK